MRVAALQFVEVVFKTRLRRDKVASVEATLASAIESAAYSVCTVQRISVSCLSMLSRLSCALEKTGLCPFSWSFLLWRK